jgi:hypothetical protein
MMANIIASGNYTGISEALVKVPEPEGMEGIAKAVNDAVRQYALSSAEPVASLDVDSKSWTPLQFYSLKQGDWSEFRTDVRILLRAKVRGELHK